MTDDLRLQQAKRHVAALRGFYIHLIIFTCVMSGLIGINVATKTAWWVHWPLLGWGIGILGHGLGLLAPISLFGKAWEDKKVKDYMARAELRPAPDGGAAPTTDRRAP
ncbi:MAG: 2TM domain-containing protein [Hyphomicrobiaceae bacterium]